MVAEALIEASVKLRFVPPCLQSRGDHRITRRARQGLLVDLNRRVNVALAIEDVAEQTRGLGQRRIDLQRRFEGLPRVVQMAEQEFGKADAEHRLETTGFETQRLAKRIRCLLRLPGANRSPSGPLSRDRSLLLSERYRRAERRGEQEGEPQRAHWGQPRTGCPQQYQDS